jgi:hypothetical protein
MAALVGQRANNVLGQSLTRHAASAAKADNIIESLQGYWQDDLGACIHVSGRQAAKDLFGMTGSWNLVCRDGGIFLNGAKMSGSLHQPLWTSPMGVERKWMRSLPFIGADWTGIE